MADSLTQNANQDDAALMVGNNLNNGDDDNNVFPEDPSDRSNRHVSQVFSWQPPKVPPQKRGVRGGNVTPQPRVKMTPGAKQVQA